MSDFRTLANGETLIENRVLIAFFNRKLQNSRSYKDDNSLPEEWDSFDISTFHKIVQNLDKKNTGSIDWKQLATYLCLLQSKVPDQDQITYYKKALLAIVKDKDCCSEEEFSNTRAWFDEQEVSKDRDYSIPFPRLKHLKAILWSINAGSNGFMNVEDFLTLIMCKEIVINKPKGCTYYESLFT